MKSIITFFFLFFCSLSQCAEMNENQEGQLLKSPLISNASSKNVNVSESSEEKLKNSIDQLKQEEESRFSNFTGVLFEDEDFMTKDKTLIYKTPSLKNYLAENFVEVTVMTKPIQHFNIKSQDHIDTILGSIYWYPHGENKKHAVVNIAGLQEYLHAVDDVEIKQRELLSRCLMHIAQCNVNELEDSYLEKIQENKMHKSKNILIQQEFEQLHKLVKEKIKELSQDTDELPNMINEKIKETPANTMESTGVENDQDSSENNSMRSKVDIENIFLKEQLVKTRKQVQESNNRNLELELKLLHTEKQLRTAQDKIRNDEDLELDLKTKQIQHDIALKRVKFDLSNSGELSKSESELKIAHRNWQSRREKMAWVLCGAFTLSTSYLLYKNWTKQ